MPGLPSCTAGHEAGGTVLLRDLCMDERIRSCVPKRAQSVSTCSSLQCQKSKLQQAVASALCYPQPNTVKLQQHHQMSPFHFQSREEPEPLAELIGHFCVFRQSNFSLLLVSHDTNPRTHAGNHDLQFEQLWFTVLCDCYTVEELGFLKNIYGL